MLAMVADLQRDPRFGVGAGRDDQRANYSVEWMSIGGRAKQARRGGIQLLAHGIALEFDMLYRRAITLFAQQLAGIAATPLAAGQALDRALVRADCADDCDARSQEQQVDRRRWAFASAKVQQQCGRLG